MRIVDRVSLWLADWWPLLVFLGLVALCLAGFVAVVVVTGAREAECLRLGYGSVNYSGGTVFCITREEGTEVVVTLEEARRHPRRVER